MTERLDDAPTRTWQSILAEVPEATPVGGLSAAPEPVASKVQRYARKLDRTDETPADVLAAIEYEVSEPATREALDTMRAWRARQRKETERLDELDAPDTRPWIRRKFDGFWDVFAYIAGGFAIMPLRGTESLDLSAAVAAGAALIAVVRVLAVQSGRTKGQKESRGMLLFPLAAMVIAPIALIVRLVLSRDMDEHGLLTFGGVGVLVLTAVVFTVTTLRAPTLAELVASAEQSPPERTSEDDFYDDVEARIDALYDAEKEQAPAHLRAALADRDPVIARSSRHTVLEAIRILFDREEIDGDEAAWMLREALR